MTYTNIELKYAECNFCCQEKKCYIQYEFDEKYVVCPDCLIIQDHY